MLRVGATVCTYDTAFLCLEKNFLVQPWCFLVTFQTDGKLSPFVYKCYLRFEYD